MQRVMPTMPVSDLRREQASILAMLDKSPVLLMNRGDAAGVLVSVEQWNAIADELEAARAYRNLVVLDQQSRLGAAGDFITHDQLLVKMRERGQID